MKNDVAARRRQRNWSQAELAGRLGVSRQTVIAIENGRYDPSLPLAFRLARVFDCTIEELFDDEQDAGERRELQHEHRHRPEMADDAARS